MKNTCYVCGQTGDCDCPDMADDAYFEYLEEQHSNFLEQLAYEHGEYCPAV